MDSTLWRTTSQTFRCPLSPENPTRDPRPTTCATCASTRAITSKTALRWDLWRTFAPTQTPLCSTSLLTLRAALQELWHKPLLVFSFGSYKVNDGTRSCARFSQCLSLSISLTSFGSGVTYLSDRPASVFSSHVCVCVWERVRVSVLMCIVKATVEGATTRQIDKMDQEWQAKLSGLAVEHASCFGLLPGLLTNIFPSLCHFPTGFTRWCGLFVHPLLWIRVQILDVGNYEPAIATATGLHHQRWLAAVTNNHQ